MFLSFLEPSTNVDNKIFEKGKIKRKIRSQLVLPGFHPQPLGAHQGAWTPESHER